MPIGGKKKRIEKQTKLLLEYKHEYTEQIFDIMTESIILTFNDIYDEELARTKGASVLQAFQDQIKQIPRWNREFIDSHFYRMVTRTQCTYFGDLLKATFNVYVQLILINSPDNTEKVNVKVPSAEQFFHKVLIGFGRFAWKRPYLFYHKLKSVEKQRNLTVCEGLVKKAIKSALRSSLPFEQLLKLANGKIGVWDQSDSDSSDSDNSESDAEQDDDSSDAEGGEGREGREVGVEGSEAEAEGSEAGAEGGEAEEDSEADTQEDGEEPELKSGSEAEDQDDEDGEAEAEVESDEDRSSAEDQDEGDEEADADADEDLSSVEDSEPQHSEPVVPIVTDLPGQIQEKNPNEADTDDESASSETHSGSVEALSEDVVPIETKTVLIGKSTLVSKVSEETLITKVPETIITPVTLAVPETAVAAVPVTVEEVVVTVPETSAAVAVNKEVVVTVPETTGAATVAATVVAPVAKVSPAVAAVVAEPVRAPSPNTKIVDIDDSTTSHHKKRRSGGSSSASKPRSNAFF